MKTNSLSGQDVKRIYLTALMKTGSLNQLMQITGTG